MFGLFRKKRDPAQVLEEYNHAKRHHKAVQQDLIAAEDHRRKLDTEDPVLFLEALRQEQEIEKRSRKAWRIMDDLLREMKRHL